MAQSLAWTLPGTWPTGKGGAVARREAGAEAAVHDARADQAVQGAALEELDEPTLVAACVAGRPGAFDLIVERHRRPVYQLCYRFVGNHEDASDLSQDVFLRAYRGLSAFRGGSSLATWLYRIGVNVCLNRVGRKTSPTENLDARQHIDTRTES